MLHIISVPSSFVVETMLCTTKSLYFLEFYLSCLHKGQSAEFASCNFCTFFYVSAWLWQKIVVQTWNMVSNDVLKTHFLFI